MIVLLIPISYVFSIYVGSTNVDQIKYKRQTYNLNWIYGERNEKRNIKQKWNRIFILVIVGDHGVSIKNLIDKSNSLWIYYLALKYVLYRENVNCST